MFQSKVIQECLAGMVGFYQSYDPAYPVLDNDLSMPDSGLFVQGIHPVITVENIVNVAPEFQSFIYPDYDATASYKIGQKVKEGTGIFQALKPLNPGVMPGADATAWKAIDPLSEWLRDIYREACNNLAIALVRQKKLQSAGKSLLESQQLYQGHGMLTDRIVKRGRFVGFEISTVSAEGLVTTISKIGLQLDTAQTLPVYLYNSSQAGPVAEFAVTVDRAYNFSWKDLTGAVMAYMGDADSGSRWYIGYYEDDLQGQAINKDMNFTVAPCQSCDQFNINAYNRWSKYVGIRAFTVADTYLQPDKSLFDTSKIVFDYKYNWGMNMSIAVTCDISGLICRNRYVLANALRYQIGLDLLFVIGFNTRMNAISETTKKLARAELSEKPGSGSFKLLYLDELTAANIDMTGLNASCFPCSTKGQIRYGAV